MKITLGSLIQVVVLLGTILLAWGSLKGRIMVLEQEQGETTEAIKDVNKQMQTVTLYIGQQQGMERARRLLNEK